MIDGIKSEPLFTHTLLVLDDHTFDNVRIWVTFSLLSWRGLGWWCIYGIEVIGLRLIVVIDQVIDSLVSLFSIHIKI